MNTPSDAYHNVIMNWLDEGDLDNEDRAAIEAELKRHAAARNQTEEMQDVVGLLKSAGLMEKTALHREILMRWVDNEMSEQERSCFQMMLSVDAELQAEAESMRRLSDDVRRSFAMETPLPDPEAFNAQIYETIAPGTPLPSAGNFLRNMEAIGINEEEALRQMMLMQYLDGELSAEEGAAFAELLHAEPALSAQVTQLSQLGQALRQSCKMELPLASPDLFNEKIRAQIAG